MAAEEDLIREYVDRTGFASDTKFILDELNKVYAVFQQLDKFKFSIDKSSGLSAVAGFAKQAGTEFEKLEDAIGKIGEATKKQTSTNKQLTSSYDDLLQASAKNKIASKELAAEEKKLEKSYKDKKLTLQEYEKALASVKERQIALAVSGQQVNVALKNIEKEAQAAEGSLDQLRAQLNISTQAFDKMSAAEKASATGNALFNKINSLTKVISDQEQATGRFQRNVGNYQGSAKIIVDALERSRTKVIEVGRAFGQTSPEAAAARKEFEALDRLTGDPQFLNVASKFGDTNRELKFFAKQLNQLEDAGLKNSQVYADVQKRLAHLTDQIGDTRAEIKALSSDTRGFDLFAGAVSFAADTFQAAAGAAVLFGASEEDAAKATKTLIAVQSVANGVKGIANELTTKGTAANKVFAFTQNLVAKSLDTSASAFSRFKAALGIIGLIATVIGGIVLAYNLWSKSAKEVASKQKMLNDLTKEAADSYGKEKAELDILVGVINKEGATRKEKLNALKDLQEKYPGYFDNLKTEKDLNNELATAYANAAAGILQKATAQAAADKLSVNAAKKLNLELDFANESERFEKEMIDHRSKLRQQDRKQFEIDLVKERDLRKSEFEQKKADIDKENKFLLSIAVDQKQKDEGNKKPDKDKSGDKAKEAADKELQVQFNLLKLGLQQIVDFNKEIVDDETKTAEQRLIALQKYYIARNQIADAQAKLDKKLGKKTTSELTLIDRDLADEKLRISREVVDKSAEIQKNGVSAGLQLSKEEKEHLDQIGQDLLKGFQDRADKELEIAKNLIDKKKELKDQEKELYKNLYGELEKFAVDFFNSQLEKQQQANLDEIAGIDAKKQKDIDAINQTVTDRTKAAAEIAIIEATSQAKKEQLEEKNRQIEKRKASTERLGKIAEIAGETAQGVAALSVKAAEARAEAAVLASNPLTASFAPVALANSALISAQIPLVIGISAAQIARLVLPKFKDGKFDDYEGPAIWGDGGKSELKLSADGSMEVSPSTPTFTHVKRDDIILPDADMAFRMAMASTGRRHQNILAGMGVSSSSELSMAQVSGEIKAMRKDVVNAIKNKKEYHFPKRSLSDVVNRTIDGNKEYFDRNGFTPWS
jgi:hypothetical protein